MLPRIDDRAAQTVGLHDGLGARTVACSQEGEGVPRLHYVKPPRGGRPTIWSRSKRGSPGRCRRGLGCPSRRRRPHGRARSRKRRSGRKRGQGYRGSGGQRRLSGSRPDHYRRGALPWHILVGQQKAAKHRHQNHPYDDAGRPETTQPIYELVAALFFL